MIGRGRDLSVARDEIRIEVRSGGAQRLDRFLNEHLAWRSRTRLKEVIQSGFVRVNGEEAKPSRKVRLGDSITVELSRGTGLPETYTDRELDVVYEDDWLVVIDKPPGILVHPVGRHVYDTLINYLHHRYHGYTTEDGERLVPRLCHRLDRDTTGILVVGKDPWVHRRVQWQFEHRRVTKEYIALVGGEYPEEAERIDLAIGEGRCLRSALEHAVLKPSRTDVRVIERLRNHTLVACRPLTGRQNQIRVHLAAAGFPIAGDTRYGERTTAAELPSRYLLHSHSLRFWHPRWKSVVELETPLPLDFHAALERLR